MSSHSISNFMKPVLEMLLSELVSLAL